MEVLTLVPTTNLPGTHPSVLAASPASVVRRRRICRNGKLEMTNFGTLRRLLYPCLNISICFRQTGTMSSFLRTAILNYIEDIKSFDVRFESGLILEDSAYDNRHASYGIRNLNCANWHRSSEKLCDQTADAYPNGGLLCYRCNSIANSTFDGRKNV
jgi:hypothetical protein